MRFCNQVGIPHSQFLEWEPDDRNKALAFIYEDATKCGMCGTADWEWVEDGPDGPVPIRSYEPVTHFCMGCYLRSIAGEDSAKPGESVRLVHVDSQEAAKHYVSQLRAWERKLEGEEDG